MKRIVICADGTWNDRDQINKQFGRLEHRGLSNGASMSSWSL